MQRFVSDEDIQIILLHLVDDLKFEDKKELPTVEQYKKIKVGMSLDEVDRLIGKPQRDIGSGVNLYQFDIEGGSVLEMTFFLDVEKENEYVHNNPYAAVYGSHCLYVAEVKFTDDHIPDIHEWGKQ